MNSQNPFHPGSAQKARLMPCCIQSGQNGASIITSPTLRIKSLLGKDIHQA